MESGFLVSFVADTVFHKKNPKTSTVECSPRKKQLHPLLLRIKRTFYCLSKPKTHGASWLIQDIMMSLPLGRSDFQLCCLCNQSPSLSHRLFPVWSFSPRFQVIAIRDLPVVRKRANFRFVLYKLTYIICAGFQTQRQFNPWQRKCWFVFAVLVDEETSAGSEEPAEAQTTWGNSGQLRRAEVKPLSDGYGHEVWFWEEGTALPSPSGPNREGTHLTFTLMFCRYFFDASLTLTPEAEKSNKVTPMEMPFQSWSSSADPAGSWRNVGFCFWLSSCSGLTFWTSKTGSVRLDGLVWMLHHHSIMKASNDSFNRDFNGFAPSRT